MASVLRKESAPSFPNIKRIIQEYDLSTEQAKQIAVIDYDQSLEDYQAAVFELIKAPLELEDKRAGKEAENRTLNIKKMSAEEKMQAMELLWEDFCSRQPDFRSPDWHEAILNEREKRLKEGKDRLIDWEQAKREIRESLP